MNRTKKMEKIKVTILLPNATGNGYSEQTVIKNAWKCKTCGFVWRMQREAQNCGHTGKYIRIYGGYFANNIHVGGQKTTFHAIRKELIENESFM